MVPLIIRIDHAPLDPATLAGEAKTKARTWMAIRPRTGSAPSLQKLVADGAAIKPDILEKVRAAYATGN
jgi:hypothetical protein